MMSTTHAAMGAALATPLWAVAPEFAPAATLAAFLGGLFPDADAVAGAHRRTLHHPELYPALTAAAVGAAAVRPATATVATAAFLGSAALHSLVDVFGGGLALRPWVADDGRGIYLHTQQRWVPPRRWVRYDGAPEDLALVGALTVPVALAGGPTRWLALAGLVVSAAYTAFRKPLVEQYPGLFEN
ncbi:MAG: metal-dependent hydrolase [Halobacteriaceae archaeon]